MRHFCALVVLAVLGLPGCTLAGSRADETQRVRAEQAFRDQNRLVSQLMLLEAPSPDLVEAEQRLRTACAPLNELAALRRDGRRIGFFRRLRIPRSIAGCEAETAALRALLDADPSGE